MSGHSDGPGPAIEAEFEDPSEAESWLRSLEQTQTAEIVLEVSDDERRAEYQLLGNFNPVVSARAAPVVTLYSNGSAFMAPGGIGDPDAEFEEAVERFEWLCSKACPTYGAITVEYDLEAPQEIIERPHSEAFKDCFLGADLGQRLLDRAEALFEDAIARSDGCGLFLSCGTMWRLRRDAAGRAKAEQRSYAIGELLAEHFRGPLGPA